MINERVRELAKQAWIEVATKECHNEYKFGKNGEFALNSLNTTFDKFAELMVRECLKVVQDGGGMCGAISSNNIKQHFGLEE